MTALAMLAFDHRSSFSRDLLGIEGAPTRDQARRVSDLKELVYEGFLAALTLGVDRESAGLLVDEQYGSRIALDARTEGVVLAMPVERSGRAEFDFEFGEKFGAHIERYNPTYAKVLVRYNPEGDPESNRRQRDRLRILSNWLLATRRKLLFELLVPAEPAQLAAVGGDVLRYDREIRPGLVVETIREFQEAAVEPALWKIEGLDRREDCERVAAQAQAGRRRDVGCIVLGRGAEEERVVTWLEAAAPVEGFVGFAVGRTLWWNELVGYVAGDLRRNDAAVRIGENYHAMTELYERCAA